MGWGARIIAVVGLLLAGCAQVPMELPAPVNAGPMAAKLGEGEAVWVVGVDERGRVLDVLPASGDPALLGAASEAFVRGVAFTAGGRFVHLAVRIFAEEGEVYLNAFDVELLDAPGFGKGAGPKRIVQVDRADARPVLLHEVKPELTASAGEVIVQYFIDETGGVRMPMVLVSQGKAADQAVLRALREWRFAAPTRGGNPVTLLVRQRFRF